MKAAILVKQNTPLVVAEIELPKTLEYGQVLVKVHYSGICGAQINEIDGVKGQDKFLPHLLGHEGGAVVEKCGPGVSHVKKGNHVVMHWRKGEGIQSSLPVYRWNGKKVNAGWVTTFNEYAVVSENRITPISKEIDLKIACLYGCAVTTSFGVVHNDAHLKAGESIVVFGAGGVGSAIILASSAVRAFPVVAVDINDYKLQMAKKIGATYTINSKREKIKEKLNEYLGALGADVTVETTGIREVRELAFETANPLGRTVLVGVPKKGEKMCLDSFPLHFKKKITGSHGGDSNPAYDIPRLIRLQKAGRLTLDKLITKIYPLERINQAIEALRKGSIVRCAVKLRP